MPDINFTCSCGHPHAPPDLRVMPWAVLTGHGTHLSARWHATRESALRDAAPYDYPQRTPRIGETLWLRLSKPFAHKGNRPFWLVFEPALVAFNGLDEDTAHLLTQMALVHCRIVRWESVGKDVIAEIKAEAVLTLADLTAQPLRGATTPELWREFYGANLRVTPDGPFLYLESDLQGDIGVWAVVHLSASGPRLLIFNRWGAHEDHVWVGCADIDDFGRKLLRVA